MIKPLKDQLEVKNHIDAVAFIEQLIHEEQVLNLEVILEIHRLLFNEIYNHAGKLRDSVARIDGALFMPPRPEDIIDEVDRLLSFTYFELENERDPIEVAAIFHHRIVKIHPFHDGNGRTARLIMNKLLMEHDFPYITYIRERDREKYLDCLVCADLGDDREICNYVAMCVERTIDEYLHIFEDPEVLTLAQAAEISPYSQGYLSLLARRGLIGAYKNGRNWVITRNDLEDYHCSIQEKRSRARKRILQRLRA